MSTISIKKNVSAHTVTELSRAASPTSQFLTAETPPTTAQMIEQVRADLISQIPPESTDPGFIQSPKPAKNLRKFEEIITNIPRGFCLKPVLYSKIKTEQNKEVMGEFTKRVRPFFLQYLANTHAHELRALGICRHGIKQMKKGLDPDNGDGIPYAVDVDHVIERSGSGTRAFKKKVDSLMLVGSTPTFEINHFSNLFLMPDWMQEIKNDLNYLQKNFQIESGERKWMLMMVPETPHNRSGFVARPQKPDHPLHTLPLVSQSTAEKIVHAGYKTQLAFTSLQTFFKDPAIGFILKENDMILPNVSKQGLSTIFNKAVSKNLLLQNAYLGSTFDDANRWFQKAFEEAKGNAVNLKRFKKIFETSEMDCLYKRIPNVPLIQAEKMHRTMQNIRGSLDNMTNQNSSTSPGAPKL